MNRRRHLLSLSGSALLLGACAQLRSKLSSTNDSPDQLNNEHNTTMMNAKLNDFYSLCLEESPHNATAYGLDVGPHQALRSRWPQRSRDHAYSLAQGYTATLAGLKAIPRRDLDPQLGATSDAAVFALECAIEGSTFAYGDQTLMPMIDQESTPYPINQMIGLVAGGMQLLVSQQPIQTKLDRELYVARLAALGPAIDAETRWFLDDATRGVRPPRFILNTLRMQLEAMLSTPVAEARVAIAYAAAAQSSDDVFRLLDQVVYPAVMRQRDAVLAELPRATDAAGVRYLPDGERYYAWALRVATTTSMTAAEVHTLGQEQSAMIASRMDRLLKRQGMTEGSVGERMRALSADPRHRFANNETGRGEAIAFSNAWVERMRRAMPVWSTANLKAQVRVERVPPEREAGAAGAYMAPGTVDGLRPSVFYLNLRDTATWPRWALPTLVAHETLPGHAWQEAYEIERSRRHPIRSLLRFNGFSEGWALYAEQLVDEAGFYNDDPLAQLGYLQAEQLRATRLVVDTGLHALGWTRELAVETLADATGRPVAAVQSEIDRYCVKPGQACGYKIGQLEMLRMRERWLQSRPGDHVGFNDAVLRAGNLPLSVLDEVLSTT
jgi:uncharacterized protein (DUF885 family)